MHCGVRLSRSAVCVFVQSVRAGRKQIQLLENNSALIIRVHMVREMNLRAKSGAVAILALIMLILNNRTELYMLISSE